MNILESKKDLLLRELLRNYLTKQEISEFIKNYKGKASGDIQTSLKVTEKSKKQIEVRFEDPKFRMEVDLFITFAETKFPKNKFLELLLSLGGFAITSGEFNLAVDIHEKLLNETKNQQEFFNINASSYLAMGDIYSRQAQWQLSLNNIKKARKYFNKQNDIKGIAKCENILGTIYGEVGNLKKAKHHFEKSLSLVQDLKDKVLTGKVEINLGIINIIQGNYDIALSFYQRALLNFQKISDHKRIAEIKHNIGMTYLKQQKFENALNQFDQSISSSMQAGFLPTLGITYVSKAYLYTLLNDFTLADAFCDKAMEICNKTNDKLSIAEVYKVKGIIQRKLNNYESSESFLQTSLRINNELGNKLNSAETSYELAILYRETGNPDSKKYFDAALKYFKSINAKPDILHISSEMNS